MNHMYYFIYMHVKKMKDDDEVPKFYVHEMGEDDMDQLVSSILFILILHI